MPRLRSFLLAVVLLIATGDLEHLSPVAAVETPAASASRVLVLGHPTRLTVSLYLPNPQGTLELRKHGTTNNPRVVEPVVRLLNHLAPIPSGIVNCPALPSRTVLRFGYKNGDLWTVYEDGCYHFHAHGVSGSVLGEPRVYAALSRLIGKIL